MVHPIRPREGEDEYITVVLNATICHIKLCTGAQEKRLQFPNGFSRIDNFVCLKNRFLTSCYSLVVRMGVSLVPDWKGYISKSQVSSKLLEFECWYIGNCKSHFVFAKR